MINDVDWSNQLYDDLQKRKETLVSLSKTNALITLDKKISINLSLSFNEINKYLTNDDIIIKIHDGHDDTKVSNNGITIFCNQDGNSKITSFVKKIIKKQKESESEKGIHTLFLCCGVAKWNDSKGVPL